MDRGRNEILFWFIHKLFKSEVEEFWKVGNFPVFQMKMKQRKAALQCFQAQTLEHGLIWMNSVHLGADFIFYYHQSSLFGF